MTATLFDIPSAPVDAATASLLDLIAYDPIHQRDRATVVAAVVRTAQDNGGVVDPNHLRPLLWNEHGCTVDPHVIGATVRALSLSGALVFTGWVETTGSTSGNNGRPARAYRLTHSP